MFDVRWTVSTFVFWLSWRESERIGGVFVHIAKRFKANGYLAGFWVERMMSFH